MNQNKQLQEWLDDDRYITSFELKKMWDSEQIWYLLKRFNIKPEKTLNIGRSEVRFYSAELCNNHRKFKDLPRMRIHSKSALADNPHYISKSELMKRISPCSLKSFLTYHKICVAEYSYPESSHFYNRSQCEAAINIDNNRPEKNIGADSAELLDQWLNDKRYVRVDELCGLWQIKIENVWNILSKNKIKPVKTINTSFRGKRIVFYSKSRCERARRFINETR